MAAGPGRKASKSRVAHASSIRTSGTVATAADGSLREVMNRLGHSTAVAAGTPPSPAS
jgi:hypothetical protein